MKVRLLVFLLVLLLSGIVFLSFSFTGTIEEDWYEHTKAICSGNSCQDFLISCNGNEFVEMSPISGKVVFGDSWEDKREDSGLC